MVHRGLPQVGSLVVDYFLNHRLAGSLFPATNWAVLLAAVTFATGFITAGIRLICVTEA
jgi:hypothetical protein